MTEKTIVVQWNELKNFVKNVFKTIGFSEEHAALAAEVLTMSDIRGIASHGVARLQGYVNLWQKNRLNVTPKFKIVHETPSTATLDADQGVGLVSAPYAMQLAIKKARQCGTGWVAVKNSNHFGIAGYHAMMALKEDMIGFAMTNASPLAAPTFSKSRLLGTNPIACAIPADKERPVVIDMATTAVANGKLEVAQRKGAAIPEGWVQSRDGKTTTSAKALKEGGAMLPLGSDAEHSSYKGYCLGGLVDILTAVLSGANYAKWVPPFPAFMQPLDEKVGEGIGHFVGAMRIDAFRPAEEFKRHMDNWIQTMHDADPVEGKKVLVPGEPENILTELYTKKGIPLHKIVFQNLKKIKR